MRYVLKQKLLSWGDDYVRDDQGRDVYFIDGKAFSLGGQLSFKDMEGNELAFIRQKLLKLSPTYEIHDTYGIEIADGEDDVLILAAAVVVDQACHRDDGERH